MLSNELQTGKAGEHLACCDLLYLGKNAFLTDQGLPYDIVLDIEGQILRVQCKTATKPIVKANTNGQKYYIFNLRRGRSRKQAPSKGNERKLPLKETDLIAFVALDIKQIAYVPTKELVGKSDKHLVQLLVFRSPNEVYTNRRYTTGTIRKDTTRYINQCPLDAALLSIQTKTASETGTSTFAAVKDCLVTGS